MTIPEEPIIAIVCRDERGIWQRVLCAETRVGDDVLLLASEKGLVAILGRVCDEDYPAILRIIAEI